VRTTRIGAGAPTRKFSTRTSHPSGEVADDFLSTLGFRSTARRRVPGDRLDLDDVLTEVGKDGRAVPPGERAGDIQDPDALENGRAPEGAAAVTGALLPIMVHGADRSLDVDTWFEVSQRPPETLWSAQRTGIVGE